MWDSDCEPLAKILFSGKKAVNSKQSAELGKKVVNIVRTKDIVKFFNDSDNLKLFVAKCPKLAAKHVNGSQVDVPALLRLLATLGFTSRCESVDAGGSKATPQPSGSGADGTGDAAGTSDAKPGKRKVFWPERVVRLRAEAADSAYEDSGAFYIVLYEVNRWFVRIFSAVAVVIVLLATMFHAWPYWAKVGLWYLIFSLSSSMLTLVFVRMVLYGMMWCVGVDFWLFPNLLDEYAGVIDSFKPLYSFQRRKDGYLMTAARVATIIIVGLAVYEYKDEVTLADVVDFVQVTVTDILEWGKDKFTALPVSTPKYPTLEEVSKMTSTPEVDDEM